MAIPGYDIDDVEEFVLEREADGEGASASIAADGVPDAVALEASGADRPAGALAEPVDFVGATELAALDALRVALEYDPGALPAGASPTAVAVGVLTDEGVETLESTVDLEATTVSATTTEPLPGETVVAVHDGE